MRTDELIDSLARNLEPVSPHRGPRALALALALSAAAILVLMLALLGLNPLLREHLAQPMFWIKLGFGVALGAAALTLTLRLARPGVRAGAAPLAALAPAALLWLLALVALAQAAPDARTALVLGESWRSCSPSIAALSLPVLAAALAALRTMAPTRPAAAGAGAGALAGGIASTVYALHCPELAAPFLAVWYVLGVLVPIAAGALVAPRLLRW